MIGSEPCRDVKGGMMEESGLGVKLHQTMDNGGPENRVKMNGLQESMADIALHPSLHSVAYVPGC